MSSSSLTGGHILSKLTFRGNAVCVARNRSSCLANALLKHGVNSSCFSGANDSIVSYGRCRDYRDPCVAGYGGGCRDGPQHMSSSSSSSSAACASPSQTHATTDDSDSDREDADADSDSDSDSDSRLETPSTNQKMQVLKEAASSLLPAPSNSLEPESWLLMDGEDVPHLISNQPLTKRYAPRRLLEFVAKKLNSDMFSPAQLKSALMFWKKQENLQGNTSFAASAFGEKGVSQLHQWTATELTLQHARLTRIARDILYLVLACSLLGFVRVLEAILLTFSTSPPHYSKLLEAANSLDFFTMAFLAHSLRKPIIDILRVDPTNLDDVLQLKAKIWDEMHKFYERQWKLVATLGVGRLLALIAQKLPSTNSMTRNVKMCWDFLLALPIF